MEYSRNTIRASDLDQLRRLKTRKHVVGLNDVSLNFESQTPKNEILGPWIGFSSVNDKNLKYL